MSDNRNKRVLIVSYYWPPSAGSGVQRWLKLTKYLHEFGWEALVYTPENPDFNLQDETLLKDVSPELIVLKRKIFEPYAIARMLTGKKNINTGLVSSQKKQSGITKWMNWIRGNLFIPDPRAIWVKPSIRYLKNYLRKNPVDAIITTGPPHSMHLIGMGLKKELDLPWVVDIRDPWSRLDFLKTFNLSENSKKKYHRMESKVMKSCDWIIGTSYSMPELLVDVDLDKFTTVTNGFDQSDFDQTTSDNSNQEEIIFYHAGLLNNLRNPQEIWNCIEAYNQANEK